MNTLILLVFAVMIAVEQAAPISSNNTTTATNAPITDTNIPALKAKAEREIISILQEIQQLEKNNVRLSVYS